VLSLFFIAACVPVIYLFYLPDVPALVHHNPVKTPLMVLREKQAKAAGKTLKTTYVWKDLNDISPNLVHAVLLSEDDMFYQHHGFDMEQIEIAIKEDLEKKRYAYGGSTISQQCARSLFLSPRKNLFRKAKEALITILLERYLTKQRIMELYLNVIEWGPGIYGAEAASQAYFQKPASELTPDEGAALASILPSPRRWSPTSEKGFMARRRTRLVARMRRAGYLPPENVGPDVPEEIRQMAIQANQFIQQRDQEDNVINLDDDSDSNAEPETPDTDQNDQGLYTPGHAQAPSPQ